MGLGDTPPALLMLILSFIPITWAEYTTFSPFLVQTALISTPLLIGVFAYRIFRRKWIFALLIPGYALTTFISNVLMMNVWNY